MNETLFDSIKRQFEGFKSENEKIAFLEGILNFTQYLEATKNNEIVYWVIEIYHNLTEAK